MRSRSMRAFIRRISRRHSSGNGSRYTYCVRGVEERAPRSASPATSRALRQRLELPHLRPLLPVRLVARRASGRARPACPRAAAARRRGTSGPPPCVSPIARTSRVAIRSAIVEVGRRRRRRTRTSRRCRMRTTARAPPSRPRPITANGSVGLERLQRGLDARVGEVRQLAADGRRGRRSPSRSRAPMRRSWRRLKRRSPSRRARSSSRQSSVSSASSTSSARRRFRGRARRRRRARRRSRAGGAARSPSTRLEPRMRHVRSAATGVSRKRRASVDDRV